MRTGPRILGHQVHPIFVAFPLGLLPVGLIFDVVAWATDGTRWADAAWLVTGAGLLGAVVAAITGVIDWLPVPARSRAKVIGMVHAGAVLLAVTLLGVSWLLRRGLELPTVTTLALSLAGVLVLSVGGWFGGELVERYGLGVDPDAERNAAEPPAA